MRGQTTSLPVAAAERLVTVATTRSIGLGSSTAGLPYQIWEQFWVDGSYFDTLGVSAILGRALTPDDDRRRGDAAR